MNILIPINDEKNLCSMETNSSWAVATLDEGQTKNLSFYKTREEITEFTEYVVVISKEEFVSDFFLEGIGILIAPMQKTIDDIVEAYMFRELHEVTS
ncbi:MAG TPA: hypothetical protein EYG93_00365 [Sulfurospirillum arcachonense]|nr:hypothetical protein [Sulfurospirillum arcachonense]HIP43777.1 hypothetical protein [Sulfurospirillum arcachonense]